jgi:CRP-like cAMP-binding protein
LDDAIVYSSLGLSMIAVALTVFWFRYFPTLRKAAHEFAESSEIVKGVVEEFNVRMREQDRRMADIAIKLEVLEDRWFRGGLPSSRSSDVHYRPFVGRNELFSASDAVTSQGLGSVSRGFEPDKRTTQSGKVNMRLNRVEQKVVDRLGEGPLTARQVQELLGSSREHAARLMKGLYNRGLVERDESKKPFTYRLPFGRADT